ncbi:hypothetical protein HELRODRAFT_159178 [Helobdella robusta]|uniref:SUEL-type lectin domain-containing protein n=1 Tax=Helobdella robusta TaxID=6412 RepID=T1ENP9_HELRO|nr:hypothetical protein HELRODRAFT_159178 [Helobdella robusta]ESO12611.1 hypothetical protein HELRODRAFT_159178 [Helobdella robusta]
MATLRFTNNSTIFCFVRCISHRLITSSSVWLNWIESNVVQLLDCENKSNDVGLQSSNLSRRCQHRSDEYCDTEVFRAECSENHVILIQKALYGRMRLGRCVEIGMGNIGCYSDVIKMTDKRCSGRRMCELRVPDAEFELFVPCLKELKSYLNAAYECVKGVFEIWGRSSLRRIQPLYVSVGHTIRINLPSLDEQFKFLIHYQIVGCPLPNLPDGALFFNEMNNNINNINNNINSISNNINSINNNINSISNNIHSINNNVNSINNNANNNYRANSRSSGNDSPGNIRTNKNAMRSKDSSSTNVITSQNVHDANNKNITKEIKNDNEDVNSINVHTKSTKHTEGYSIRNKTTHYGHKNSIKNVQKFHRANDNNNYINRITDDMINRNDINNNNKNINNNNLNNHINKNIIINNNKNSINYTHYNMLISCVYNNNQWLITCQDGTWSALGLINCVKG